jgi:hypothetical protein
LLQQGSKTVRIRQDGTDRRLAMPTPAELFVGLLLSSIGLGYFIYGRKTARPLALGCGLLMMVFPYVVAGVWPQLWLGVVLMLLPWLFR